MIPYLKRLGLSMRHTSSLCFVSTTGLILMKGLIVAETLVLTVSALAADNYSPPVNRTYPDQVYWGDTHVHTSLSSGDAYPRGNHFSPRIAYRFARGETVNAANGEQVRLRRPLDFLVVADHAEALGVRYSLQESSPSLTETEAGRALQAAIRTNQQAPSDANQEAVGAAWNAVIRDPAYGSAIWRNVVANADAFNDPGRFTAFAGYEWSSVGSVSGVFGNLHRVVIFREGAGVADQVRPFSAYDSLNPEDLWRFFEGYEEQTKGRVFSIPHNPNNSNGEMFALNTFDGSPLTQGWARLRARWEPLLEVTQLKGDSETHPVLSPNDQFADFETWHSWAGMTESYQNHPCCKARTRDDFTAADFKEMKKGEYARHALQRGLKVRRDVGVNPYKFGMIGSTDSHTSLATADNDNFWGKYSETLPRAERPQSRFVEGWEYPLNWETAAAGYAGVWATENTRESLFAAMQRKEVYATTGPRVTVRFFGGWTFETLDASHPRLADIGYTKGVPMGGDLTRAPVGKAPTFLLRAVRDPHGANLDRIQVIKGWLSEDGQVHEKVHDVALGDGRKIRRRIKPVGTTVDVADASYSNSIGNPELATVWEDPNFDASQPAFYYVRVLEIPTPRWTAFDAKHFEINDLPDNVVMVSQERAYTSPIWYIP